MFAVNRLWIFAVAFFLVATACSSDSAENVRVQQQSRPEGTAELVEDVPEATAAITASEVTATPTPQSSVQEDADVEFASEDSLELVFLRQEPLRVVGDSPKEYDPWIFIVKGFDLSTMSIEEFVEALGWPLGAGWGVRGQEITIFMDPHVPSGTYTVFFQPAGVEEPAVVEIEHEGVVSTVVAPSAPTETPILSSTVTPEPTVATSDVVSEPSMTTEVAVLAQAELRFGLTVRERGLLDAMNREREVAGFAPLRLDATLINIARERSQDMVDNSYFAHFGPSGESTFALVAIYGLQFSAIGENLARVRGNEDESVRLAITNLMASPSHRSNILKERYTLVGVGTVRNAIGLTVFTTVFAAE